MVTVQGLDVAHPSYIHTYIFWKNNRSVMVTVQGPDVAHSSYIHTSPGT
jgi:hypothetical protein